MTSSYSIKYVDVVYNGVRYEWSVLTTKTRYTTIVSCPELTDRLEEAVSVPIDLHVTTNPDGQHVTLLYGNFKKRYITQYGWGRYGFFVDMIDGDHIRAFRNAGTITDWMLTDWMIKGVMIRDAMRSVWTKESNEKTQSNSANMDKLPRIALMYMLELISITKQLGM